MNRRSDHALRESISTLERLLLTAHSADTILERSLEELARLLDAEQGYAFEVQPSEGATVSWNMVAYGEREDNFILKSSASVSSTLPQALLFQFRSGRMSYGEGGLPPEHAQPLAAAPVHNYLCIPLADMRNLYGVLYLSNLPTPVSEVEIERLRPFVTAACCLLRASWSNALKNRPVDQALTNKPLPPSLDKLFNSLFDGVLLVDAQNTILRANRAAAETLRTPLSQLAGLSVSTFVDSTIMSHLQGTGQLLGAESEQPGATIRGVSLVPSSGSKRLADIRIFPCGFWGDDCRGIVINDISEQVRSTAEYRDSQQRLRALTTLAPVGILQLDRNWECSYVNDTWCDYVGMTADEMMGVGWGNAIHQLDYDRFLEQVRKKATGHGRYSGDVRFQTPQGEVRWASVSACMLYDETGALDGLLMTQNDITDYLRKEQRLREIAEHDQLTGLANRTCFHNRLTSALEESERYGAVALMYIDLDNFKHINDTLGHDAGDELLIQVARRLQEQIRKVDTIARVGGDEFTVILTHLSNQTAVKMVAEKLLRALSEPFELANRNIYVTCSIGISVVNEMTDRKQFLKQADIALYKAKESGRNQYRFYTSELNRDAHMMMSIRESVKARIEEDFHLVFQPQYNARSGDVIGLEALVRWRHESEPNISPSVFIRLIEESGLICEFSSWLFAETFRLSEQWKSHLKQGCKISINLSERQFLSDELMADLSVMPVKYGLQAAWFALEIREKALLANPERAAKLLESLSHDGFEIYLDNFGAGYSALMHLQTMPVHGIKIDRAFTAELVANKQNERVAKALLNMAEALELKVIAEGIESIAVSEWLILNNCDFQQGYFLSEVIEPENVGEVFVGCGYYY